jgi:nitroimidazol reductase NimA-like FMN-containing flavoprotein (pyridoxamine 5'-phosphate oxidase superfamily)
MIGILNKEGIEGLLRNQVIGRIGCQLHNTVYVVPVSYAYDGAYIYVRSFEGKKIIMMRQNPAICFQVDNMTDLANWQSVIAYGEFEELTDTNDRKKALEVLVNRRLPLVSSETTRLGKIWPFQPEDLNAIEGIVFRVRLTEKTGRFERREAAPLVFTS